MTCSGGQAATTYEGGGEDSQEQKGEKDKNDAEEDEEEEPVKTTRTNRILPIYGDNALKSLARSHPKVLARWHPDLLVEPDGRIVRRSSAAAAAG